jgi:hypothetical protein
VAIVPEEFLFAVLILGGAVGVAFYGLSSHRIGARFGLVSVPYAAVYGVLLVVAFSGSAQAFDLPTAVLMSMITWGLYTHTLLKSKLIKRRLAVQIPAIGIGFLALVIFPLFTVAGLQTVFAVLYRGAALAGWIAGAKPGLEREARKP